MNNNFNLKQFLAEGKLLNENTLEDDIKDFIYNVEIDNYQRSDDDDYEEAEADLEFFLDMYPEYKGREEEIQKILNDNGNPLGEIQVNKPGVSFEQLVDAIPNEKYFYIADEQADTFFNPEESGPNYDWAGFDDDDGDLVDYFYDDIFNNELKGKPGVEEDDFYEWQDRDFEENNGDNVSLLYQKIMQIISDYKKLNFPN